MINVDTITKRQRPLLLNRAGQAIDFEEQPRGEIA